MTTAAQTAEANIQIEWFDEIVESYLEPVEIGRFEYTDRKDADQCILDELAVYRAALRHLESIGVDPKGGEVRVSEGFPGEIRYCPAD